MIPDPEIDEIRAVRRRISERCGHDLTRLFAHYKELEKQLHTSGQLRFAEDLEKVPSPKPAA